MTTQIASLVLDTWNARNLLTLLEVTEWARVHPNTVHPWIGDGNSKSATDFKSNGR